jgi:hypothetical protein
MKTYIIRQATFEYDDSRYGYKSRGPTVRG